MADEIKNKDNIQDINPDTVPDLAPNESHIGTVSLRSLIVFILILSICILAFLSKDIPEIVGNLALGGMSFLFGHQAGRNSK